MKNNAIPGGALCISLDFELFWGVRDHNTLSAYAPRLLGARKAVPLMLQAFARHEVHATWATVGMLMCGGKDELLAFAPARRPAYAAAHLSPYAVVHDLGKNEQDDPYHFAPSLVERIRETPGQEIACHTFSHYYCLEKGQTRGDFAADLDAALAVARSKGLALRSLVLPRNQIRREYLPLLTERGIACYRGLPDFWAAQGGGALRRAARLADGHFPWGPCRAWPLPLAGDSRPLDIRASHFLRPWTPRLAPLRSSHLERITRDMRRAARLGRVLHIWWHPHNFGRHPEENMAGLRRLLECYAALRDSHGMRSLGMAELATLCAP